MIGAHPAPDRQAGGVIRRVVTRRRLGERGSDVAFRRSRPAAERIAHVEALRAEHYGCPMELDRDLSEFIACCIAGPAASRIWPTWTHRAAATRTPRCSSADDVRGAALCGTVPSVVPAART